MAGVWEKMCLWQRVPGVVVGSSATTGDSRWAWETAHSRGPVPATPGLSAPLGRPGERTPAAGKDRKWAARRPWRATLALSHNQDASAVPPAPPSRRRDRGWPPGPW
jgi:hypothetical protein